MVLHEAVLLFPFAYLPYLYALSHRFDSELSAVTVVTLLELIFGVMIPFAVAISRLGLNTVETADDLAFFCRLQPTCALNQSVMFNSEMVKWISDRFYPFPGEDEKLTKEEFDALESTYPTDPWSGRNAGGDYDALVLQVLAYWAILLLVVDRRGSRYGICFYKCLWNRKQKRSISAKEKQLGLSED